MFLSRHTENSRIYKCAHLSFTSSSCFSLFHPPIELLGFISTSFTFKHNTKLGVLLLNYFNFFSPITSEILFSIFNIHVFLTFYLLFFFHFHHFYRNHFGYQKNICSFVVESPSFCTISGRDFLGSLQTITMLRILFFIFKSLIY